MTGHQTDSFSIHFKSILKRSTFSILLVLLIGMPNGTLQADGLPELLNSRGIRIKIFDAPDMKFYHAQLVIYYRNEIENPAIPYITLLNLFDPDINYRYDSSLLEIIQKLGNDFEIENRPDFLTLKFNFLPDKLPLFLKFIKELFNYTGLMNPAAHYINRNGIKTLTPEEKFNISINSYWKYFFKRPDWKEQVALQIAYSRLFSSNKLGHTLVTPRLVKSVTFEQVRAFYRSIYVLPNALLVIKGHIEKPYILNGQLDLELSSYKRMLPLPEPDDDKKLFINPEKKIIVFNVNSPGKDSPNIFMYEAIPTYNKTSPLPQIVLNSILFSDYFGRLNASSNNQTMGSTSSSTRVISHKNVSIVCNYFKLSRYKDFQPFIYLVDRERKNLKNNRVDRAELSMALTGIWGRIKINTQYFDNDVNLALISTPTQVVQVTPPAILASINEFVEEPDKTLTVIFGNYKSLLPYLNSMKRQVEVIDFTQ